MPTRSSTTGRGSRRERSSSAERRTVRTIPAAPGASPRRVQRGQLYIIPNVGHNPQFEAPQLLYPPLLRFLKGEDVGTFKGTR